MAGVDGEVEPQMDGKWGRESRETVWGAEGGPPKFVGSDGLREDEGVSDVGFFTVDV